MIINLADPNIVISDRPRDSADLFNPWIANLEIDALSSLECYDSPSVRIADDDESAPKPKPQPQAKNYAARY
jgi:hypothetical protein